jgi:hypothetical protein
VVAGASSRPIGWLENATTSAAVAAYHAKAIATGGLDGLSMEQPDDVDGMTLFVQELRAAMQADDAHSQLSFCLGS